MTTGTLNQAVKRNANGFRGFCVSAYAEEVENLKFQIGISRGAGAAARHTPSPNKACDAFERSDCGALGERIAPHVLAMASLVIADFSYRSRMQPIPRIADLRTSRFVGRAPKR